jgi:biotin carboxyl carrier protein
LIGAIEALGMPTSIDAPRSGTVEELLVQDGDAVEYGQALLILRRGAYAT